MKLKKKVVVTLASIVGAAGLLAAPSALAWHHWHHNHWRGGPGYWGHSRVYYGYRHTTRVTRTCSWWGCRTYVHRHYYRPYY